MPYKIKKSGGKHCVVKDGGGQVACHATRADALKQMKALYANEKADLAHEGGLPCWSTTCDRSFLEFDQMVEHAERVHVFMEPDPDRAEALLTFDDTRKIVHEFIREKFGRMGDYKASPVIPSIWTWIEDMAVDWVVYTVEDGNETTLYKASFSITDGVVTLGEPVEVRRRTVYEPVKKES